jgi:hypothetical protein
VLVIRSNDRDRLERINAVDHTGRDDPVRTGSRLCRCPRPDAERRLLASMTMVV